MTGKWTLDLTIEKPVVIKVAKGRTKSQDHGAQHGAKEQKLLSWSSMDDWSFDNGFESD